MSAILSAIAGPLISGLFGGAGANAAAQGSREASELQQAAANKAYEGGQYKPYGVSSGLGTSSFKDGQSLFSLDPRYQGQQDQMLGLGNQAFGAAQGDYGQLANQFYNQQRDLGAGSRNAEAMRLGESMFGTGSGGLRMGAESLGAGGGGMMSPQGYGFAQAFAQQDAADRYNAFDRAQQQRATDIGIGQSMLTQSQALDQMGLSQQELGGMFGNYAANAANQAGGNLVSGMSGAAGNTQNAGMARSGGWIGAGNAVGGMFDRPLPTIKTSDYAATNVGANRINSYNAMAGRG
jgi:hypothetical protein|tara:strand:+ start:2025 stop:2903 length:879 start_codon:yes stop_codon:yes gene_type:complete